MRQIAIRLPDEMLDAIDDLLAKRIDGTDRSTLIRQLLGEAIEARTTGGKK